MSENRMTPPVEGQEKDVLLVLDKQQGKVSAVKGFDKEGNLQTVPPIQGGEFMQVDKNGDIISNLVANFYRKFHFTEGLAVFRCKASEVATKREGYRGQPPQPHAGGRQADGSTPCTETGQPGIQAGLPLRPGED